MNHKSVQQLDFFNLICGVALSVCLIALIVCFNVTVVFQQQFCNFCPSASLCSKVKSCSTVFAVCFNDYMKFK